MYFFQQIPAFTPLPSFIVLISLLNQLPALIEYRLGAFFLYGHIQAYTKIVKSFI